VVKAVAIKRGDIWQVRLDPTIRSEIQKTRPCVFVSPPELHDYLRTVIVAPMTTAKRPAPFRVPVTTSGKSGLILLDQIRTVDKVRLVKRIGTLNGATLTDTLSTLGELFAE